MPAPPVPQPTGSTTTWTPSWGWNTPSELTGGWWGGVGSTAAAPPPPPPPPPPADTGPRPRDLRTMFLSLLQAWGIPITPNLQQLVQQAVQKEYTTTTFEYYLRQTPEYISRFGGIFNKDGTMRMDESTYLSYERQFQGIGAQYGVNVGPGLVDWMFRNEVSPDEFATRAPALGMLKANPELYQQFGKALVQAGVADKGEVTRQNLMRFVLGEANQEWYKVWNLTRTRYVATQAGIQIGRHAEEYLSLRPHLIEQIANKGLSDAALSSAFADIAENLSGIYGEVEARRFGVTKKDIVRAAAGGKGAQQAREDIERAQRTQAAFYAERGGAQGYATEEGGFGVLGAGLQRKPQSQ